MCTVKNDVEIVLVSSEENFTLEITRTSVTYNIDFPADFVSTYNNQYGYYCAVLCGAAISFLSCSTDMTVTLDYINNVNTLAIRLIQYIRIFISWKIEYKKRIFQAIFHDFISLLTKILNILM